jgi:thiamine-monophosphate kinase
MPKHDPAHRTLADIGEDALIQLLTASFEFDASVLTGPGDDCAIVRGPAKNRHLVLKTDAVLEGVHFTPETQPEKIGQKALARVISDMAAMAAVPEHALITLIAPPSTTVQRIVGIYRGLRKLAAAYEIQLVGGETCRGSQLVLSISLTGSVPAQRALLRSQAQLNDRIYVTGRLGGSLQGRHLTFTPRLAEAHWLAKQIKVSAMMDLSDGLAKDLPRLAKSSQLGFQVEFSKLPCQPRCTATQAWADGEDYELLFTAPALTAAKFRSWKKAFPRTPLTEIGHMVPAADCMVMPAGGWDHFVPAQANS